MSHPRCKIWEKAFCSHAQMFRSHMGKEASLHYHFIALGVSEALLGEPSPETSSTCGGWSTAFLGPRGLCDIVLHLPLHCQTLPAFHCCAHWSPPSKAILDTKSTNFFSALQWVSRCPSCCLLRRKARAWGWWGAWKEASVDLTPQAQCQEAESKRKFL